MSIKVMTAVWDHSQHKGAPLLLLLAIADFAHEDGGGAYPSVATLAKKIRMTERNTQIMLRKLEQSGELRTDKEAGPKGANVYTVVLDKLGKKAEKDTPPKTFQGENPSSEGVKNLQGSERGGGERVFTRSTNDPSLKPPPCNPVQNPDQDAAVAAGGGGPASHKKTPTEIFLADVVGSESDKARKSVAHIPLDLVRARWERWRRENPKAGPGAFIVNLRDNPPTAGEATKTAEPIYPPFMPGWSSLTDDQQQRAWRDYDRAKGVQPSRGV